MGLKVQAELNELKHAGSRICKSQKEEKNEEEKVNEDSPQSTPKKTHPNDVSPANKNGDTDENNSRRLAEVLLNGVAKMVLIIISILVGAMSLLVLGVLLWEKLRAYKRKRRPTEYLLPRWKSELKLNR